jgi:hypothetical protein
MQYTSQYYNLQTAGDSENLLLGRPIWKKKKKKNATLT